MAIEKLRMLAKKIPLLVSIHNKVIGLYNGSIYNWRAKRHMLRVKGAFLSSIPLKDFLKPGALRNIFTFLSITPYTMLTYPRMAMLHKYATLFDHTAVDGTFVECGVWNGGSAAVVGLGTKNDRNRQIWLFDSWEGLPEPTEEDVSYQGKKGRVSMANGSSEERVRELLFDKFKLDQQKFHLVKGWFNDTIPVHENSIDKIALLHLDCDWYESVKFCLEHLYDKVVDGGVIFIDDYGYWKGCKKAVDEFIANRNLNVDIVKIDYTGVYFRKGK